MYKCSAALAIYSHQHTRVQYTPKKTRGAPRRAVPRQSQIQSCAGCHRHQAVAVVTCTCNNGDIHVRYMAGTLKAITSCKIERHSDSGALNIATAYSLDETSSPLTYHKQTVHCTFLWGSGRSSAEVRARGSPGAQCPRRAPIYPTTQHPTRSDNRLRVYRRFCWWRSRGCGGDWLLHHCSAD